MNWVYDTATRPDVTISLRGCPILLQVWAYEKLGLVAPVSDDQIGCYRSNHFQRRRMLINFRHDWGHSIMPFTNARFIRWTCPWWRLTRMTVETHLVRYVIYCSLSHSMAYFPDRIARQFMQTQGIPVPQSFAVSLLSHLLIENEHKVDDAGPTSDCLSSGCFCSTRLC